MLKKSHYLIVNLSPPEVISSTYQMNPIHPNPIFNHTFDLFRFHIHFMSIPHEFWFGTLLNHKDRPVSNVSDLVNQLLPGNTMPQMCCTRVHRSLLWNMLKPFQHSQSPRKAHTHNEYFWCLTIGETGQWSTSNQSGQLHRNRDEGQQCSSTNEETPAEGPQDFLGLHCVNK